MWIQKNGSGQKIFNLMIKLKKKISTFFDLNWGQTPNFIT